MAALAMPPLGAWPALLAGHAMFLALLETGGGGGWRRGFGTGWFYGFGYFAVAFHWIGFAFLVDAASYLWMMPFMLGALAGGMALYWGLAAVLALRAGGRGLPLALAGAACFGTAEWLRGHLLTGFPWAAPGLASDGMGGLAQVAAYVGMTGLGVLLLLWGGLVYALLSERKAFARALAVLLLLLLPVLWWLGETRISTAPVAAVPGVAVRIVQPNISQESKWREDNARAIFEQLKDMSVATTPEQPSGIGGVTHVIWPESAVPFLIDESPVAQSELKPLLGGRTVLITGALRRAPLPAGDPEVFNSIVVFNGEAEPIARYDKWRLVPGGEFLPLAWLLEPLGFRKVVRTPGSFAAGPGPVTFALPGAPDVGFLVCYEAIFPDRLVDSARRPGFLVNVTNDGWFGNSTGPHQHLAQARLRTIEQGLPLVRAANTGISAIIDPFGRILKSLPLLASGVIDSSLPQDIAPTVYAVHGDGLAAALALLCLVLAAAMHYLRRSATGDPA